MTPAGAVTRLCQANGFSPRVVLELDQQMTSYHITCAGMGIFFYQWTHLYAMSPPHPDVIYYKLPGEETRRNLYFYWKKRQIHQPCHGRIFKTWPLYSSSAPGHGKGTSLIRYTVHRDLRTQAADTVF